MGQKYKATYEFEASSPEQAAQKVFTSFYLADIEAGNVKVEQVVDGRVFSYPLAQSVIRSLQEDRNETVRRLADTPGPTPEGDWTLFDDEKAGSD